MALMAAHGEIKPMPVAAIFADTQAEPASVYRWLDWLEKQLPFPVYRVSRGPLEEETLRVWTMKNGNTTVKQSLPAWVSYNGEAKPLRRKCTADFKLSPIMREARLLMKEHSAKKCVQWIGISLDEAHRMKPSSVQYATNRWPLIDARMKREDCLRWMESHGYPKPPRSACVFCPYHSDTEWRRLRDEEPEEFAKAVQFERRMHGKHSLHSTAKCIPYLHRSCVPLDQVDFSTDVERGQGLLWGNECFGMCGV
jgi:hypothetical protein